MLHISNISSILVHLWQLTWVQNKYGCLLVIIVPGTLFLFVSNIMKWQYMSLSLILLIYETCLTNFWICGLWSQSIQRFIRVQSKGKLKSDESGLIKYQTFGIERLMGVVCLSVILSTNIALSVYTTPVCICPSIFCYHMNVHLCTAGVDFCKVFKHLVYLNANKWCATVLQGRFHQAIWKFWVRMLWHA